MSTKKYLTGPWLAAVFSIILVLVIYFFLPTKDDDQKQIEKSRALNFEKINVPVLLREAMKNLTDEEKVYLAELDRGTDIEEERVENLKALSREWFNRGEWILAGDYAEQIAAIDSSAESFAIAGNTYSIGVQRYEVEALADHAKQRAIRNYEKAISVDAEELEYRINLAVTYAERPDSDNPMKGVMMLLDLEKKYPEDHRVQNTLAYYGLQTGQTEKARKRLMKVLAENPDDKRANCLMVKLLESTGEGGAEQFAEKCNGN